MGSYHVTLGSRIAWCNALRNLMKSHSVGPQQAGVLVCIAWAVAPVCRRSAVVCVAACSAAYTARAAVPECVSLCMQLVWRAPPCACSVGARGIAGEVSQEGHKTHKCPYPQARGVVGVSTATTSGQGVGPGTR